MARVDVVREAARRRRVVGRKCIVAEIWFMMALLCWYFVADVAAAGPMELLVECYGSCKLAVWFMRKNE